MNFVKRRISLGISIAVIFCTLMVVMLLSIFCMHHGVAASSLDTILQKVEYNALGQCVNYRNNYVDHTFTPEGAGYFFPSSVAHDSPAFITLPTYASSDENLKISCAQLFKGKKKVRSDYNFGGLGNAQMDPTDLGYAPVGSTLSKRCVSVTYDFARRPTDSAVNISSNSVCFPVDSSNNVSISNPAQVTTTETSSESGKLNLIYDELSDSISACVIDGMFGGCRSVFDDGLQLNGRSLNSVLNALSSIYPSGVYDSDYCEPLYGCITASNIKGTSASDGSVASDSFELNVDSALVALRHYAGPSANYTDYALTNDDYYTLYKSYVTYVIGHYSGTVRLSTNCSESKDTYANAWSEDGQKWCEVTGAESVNERFAGRGASGWANSMKAMSFTDILKDAKNLNMSQVDSGSLGQVTGNQGNDGTVDAGEASTISPCYEGSGALGWIICPVLEAVGAATEWMYDNAVEPLLQIRADTLFSGTDGIYVGWSTFRNFSNILFAIAFAVIILAQVTGIGISNYNIKKILPRFVVVVVLVNISYILCQLAVDISNILGFSIRELFDRLPVPGVKATGGEMVVAILNGLGLAAGVGVGVNAALSSVVVVSTLKYFMVPLVLAFVGCLLGVLFFFITMSVRQTGIVILVVLAPVAIVCYALPNTKSLFDKWRKLFTALLMVYPICGLLMGGGNYVSALLLGAISGSQEGMGTLYTITALLVSILPFFLIPSLVKGSMAMMGNLGMKISNFGNGISRGLKSGVMNSRAVQERQAEQKRRLSIAQDQTKRNRIQGRVSENSFRNRARALIGRAPRTELTNREATRLARAQAGINRATSETSAALEQTWANDGTSNDFDAMKNILLTSAEAYAKDENNFEALERMNAAMRTLSGTEPGQDVIYSTFNQMEANAAQNLDEKGRIKTQRALRKMSNDLMAMSGDKIKKDAPILMRKMKNYQKMETNGNINTSYLYDNRSATGGLADLKEVASSTADLSPATMPGVNESTLQTYIDAISSGRFDRGSAEYNNVTTAARRALTDPHIKGQVKGKVATLLQQLANMDYVGTASGTAAATGSVARASEAELSRIQSGLRDMRERPDATSEPHRQQMLNTLEQTMLRGTVSNDGDEFSLSPSNATQIDKILKENGINVTERFQSGVYDVDGSPVRNMSPDQFNQRYESMMGLKIDHSDRPASSSNLGSDSTSQAQTQPERPIIQADGNQSMERIREIARENPGPRQRNSQSGPRRNGQHGNIGNNDNPPTIFT